MDQTPNLALPLIAPDQAQKHLTHNEALRVLDAIVQLRVVDRDLNAPPLSPTPGERHIVGVGATGVWAGHDAAIAAFQDGGWVFYPPGIGWIAHVADEARFVAWTGSAWAPLDASVNPAPFVGVNTTADPTNRLAVKSDAALLSHDDVTPGSGHMRVAVNKAAQGQDASVTFQTGYSARALIGTLGDDTFSLKVSPDGSTYTTALTADPATGRVTLPTGLAGTAVAGTLTATATGAPALIAKSNGFYPFAAVRAENSNNPSAISLEKSRGTGEAPLPVQSGDAIGSVTVRAFDGSLWGVGGQFRFDVDTFTGPNNFSTRFFLQVRTGGTTVSTALTVTPDLSLGVGVTSPTARLHVDGPVRHRVYTVATLPAAATVGAGTRAAVSDATSNTFGATATGGGALFAPVISNGSAWLIG